MRILETGIRRTHIGNVCKGSCLLKASQAEALTNALLWSSPPSDYTVNNYLKKHGNLYVEHSGNNLYTLFKDTTTNSQQPTVGCKSIW